MGANYPLILRTCNYLEQYALDLIQDLNRGDRQLVKTRTRDSSQIGAAMVS